MAFIPEFIGNVLWVDNIFGNDNTAKVDRQEYPWSSISSAINAASSNDTILVRPGEYVEPDFTLKPGTSLVSQGGPKVTFISASTNTGNFITVSGSSYMEGFTVYTPTDDSAAIYFNDSTAGIVTTLNDVHFKGVSTVSPPLGKGLLMDTGLATNGKIIYRELRYGGGNMDTLAEIKKGIFSVDGVHVPGGGEVTTGLRMLAGRGQFRNINLGNPNCETAISISAATVVGGSILIFNVGNGIEITGNNPQVTLQEGRIETATDGNDVLITSGLTGNGGKVHLLGFNFDSSKVSAPFTWIDSDHIFQYVDERALNKEGIPFPVVRNWGNFEVGHQNKGFETSMGRGTEYDAGMKVYTSGTTLGLVDVTTSATTDGLSFSFQTNTAGEEIYVGGTLKNSDGSYVKFNGIECVYTGTTGGTYTISVYSGSTWVPIKIQTVSHIEGYNYANTLFSRNVKSDEDIRFGVDEDTVWDDFTLDGVEGRWIKITIDTPGASNVNFDLINLEPSHTKIGKNGIPSFFGNALYVDTLVSAGNIFGESGGVVDASVPVGSGGLPTGWNHVIKNSKLNQNGDAVYLQAAFPKGICTAYPVSITIYYGLDPGDSGSAITTSPQFITSFLARGASITPVADPTGGIVPTPRDILNTDTLTSAPGSFVTSDLVPVLYPTTTNVYAGKAQAIKDIQFDIDDYYEGDGFLLRIELDDDGTPNQDVTIFAVEVDVVKWALGERIRLE